MHIGILEPNTLLGKELSHRLASSALASAEFRSFTIDPEAVGAIADVGRRASLLELWSDDAVGRLDLLFVCGPLEGESADSVLDRALGVATVVVEPTHCLAGGQELVAGVNLDALDRECGLYVSPHPVTILLALLMAPLAQWQPTQLEATALLPVSLRGTTKALDELMQQARVLLAFEGTMPAEELGERLVFDYRNGDPLPVSATLGRLLGCHVQANVAAVEGSVFHGLAVSGALTLEQAPDWSELELALGAAPYLDLASAGVVAPTAIAGEDLVRLQLRHTESQPRRIGFWLVGDNLTRGGAWNALEIAEAILSDGSMAELAPTAN